MMSNEKTVESSNKNVQTIIHCFPHMLTPDNNTVKVFCDRSCQTAVSTPPETSNLDFYALLEFVPYQVIAKSCIKELDLPRRPLLHFALSNQNTLCSFPGKSSELDLKRGVLKKSNSELNSVTSFSRALTHPVHVMHKAVVESEIQTMLSVTPHILDTDEVASVFTEVPIQTSITFVPNESDSVVIPKLQANLKHIPNSNAVLPPRLSNVSESEIEINELIEMTQVENNLTDKDVEKPKCGLQDTVNIPPLRSSQVGCNLKENPLNKIASQLRVQLSTLELTPSVFPPELEFEGRMMEVLNTTVAVFQTEMAKVLEMYHDANNTNIQYHDRDKSTKSQPSCSFKNEKPKIPSAHSDSNILTVEENGEFSSTIDQATNKALQSSLEERQESNLKATTILHEIIGDISENKRTIFIPCECHPSSFGAAPPIVTDLSTFSNEDLSDSSDVASASSYANNELSMITNDAPSLAEDLTNSENITKFEAILDINIREMTSTSATRATAVCATASCPNTNKTSKFNSGENLSDLKDQVIRLSAIHKNAPELKIEEALTSYHPIITHPHTSCTSYATTLKNFNVPHVADEKAPTCNTTVCQKKSSKHCNKLNKCTSITKRTCISEESKSSKLNIQFTQNYNAHIQPHTSVNKLVSLIECSAYKSSLYRSCTPRNDGFVSRSRNLSVFNGCEVTYPLPTKDETHNNNFMLQQYVRKPFMEELIKIEDLSAGVQTDLTLGDRLNSESLSSINIEVEITQTKSKSKIELPLETISLLPPGTNNTQPSESKDSLVEDAAPDLDCTKKERRKYNASEHYMANPYVPWRDMIISKNSRIGKAINHCDDAYNETSERFHQKIPVCSDTLQQPKIVPKRLTLHIHYTNDSNVSIEDINATMIKPGAESKLSKHIAVSGECLNKDSDIINIKPSAVCEFSNNQAVAVYSDTLQKPKRVPKRLTLHIDYTNDSNVIIKDINATMTNPGAESKSSKHLTVSGGCLNKDSDIINIKPSAVCKFLSEKFILNKSSAEVKVNDPLLYPCNTLQTKSCTAMQPSNISGKPSVNSTFQSCTSTPEVCSNLFAEVTISNKNVDKLGNVVDTANPADNPIINRECSGKPKPEATTSNKNLDKSENVVDTAKPADNPITNRECSGKPKPETTISNKNVDKSENVVYTAKPPDNPITNRECSGKPKPDAVLVAIEVYEAEMKPLMKAVDELHEKIRSLNITDMPDCSWAANLPKEENLNSYPQCMSYRKWERERLFNTSSVIPCTRAPNHYSYGTCPYFFNSQHNNMSAPMPPYTYQCYMPIICRCAISPSPDSRPGSYNCKNNKKLTDDSTINKNFQTEPKTSKDAKNCNRRYQGGNSCTPLSQFSPGVIYKNTPAAASSYPYETNLPSSASLLLNSSLGHFCHGKQIPTETSNASKCVQVEIETFKPTEDFNAMYPEEKEIVCCSLSPSSTDTMHRNASNSVLSHSQQTPTPRRSPFATVPSSDKHCCDDNQSLTDVDKATKNVQGKTEMYKASENDSRKYQDEKQEPCFPCSSPLPDALYKNTLILLPSCQTQDTSMPTYTSQNQRPGASVSMTTPNTKLGSNHYDSQAVTQNVKVNKDAQGETEMYKAVEELCFPCGSPLPDALYKNTPVSLPSYQTQDISTSVPTYTSQNQTQGASVSMTPPDTKLGSYRCDSQAVTQNVKVNKNAQGEPEMYKAPENDSKKYQDGKQKSCFPCGLPLTDALYKNTPIPLPSCQTQDTSMPTYTLQNQTPGVSVSMTTPNTKLGSYRYDSQAMTQNVKVNKDAQRETGVYKTTENHNRKYQKSCFPCGQGVDATYNKKPASFASYKYQAPSSSVTAYTPLRNPHLEYYSNHNQILNNNCKANQNLQMETESYFTTERSRMNQGEQQQSYYPSSSNTMYKTTSVLTPAYTYQMPIPSTYSYTAPQFPFYQSDYFCPHNQIPDNSSRFLKKDFQMEIETYKTLKNNINQYEDNTPNFYYSYDPFIYNNISTSMQQYEYPNYTPTASTYMTSPSADPQLCYSCNPNQVLTDKENAQAATETYNTMKNYNRKDQYVACGSSEKYRNLNNSRSSENTAFANTETDGTSFAPTHHKPHRHRHKQKEGKRLIHSCKTKSVVGLEKINNQNGYPPCVDSFEKYVRPDQAVKTSPEEFLCFSNSHEGKRNGNEEDAPSRSNFEYGFPCR